MAFLNYASASVIASLGLVCGYFLAKIAKEEIKSGKVYLQIMKSLVFSSIIFFLLYSLVNPTVAAILSALVLILTSSIKRLLNFNRIIYLLYSVLSYLANEKKLFALTASLIFIYGLPAGTLMEHDKKDLRELVKVMLVFMVISIALYFLPFDFF